MCIVTHVAHATSWYFSEEKQWYGIDFQAGQRSALLHAIALPALLVVHNLTPASYCGQLCVKIALKLILAYFIFVLLYLTVLPVLLVLVPL